MWYEVPQEKPKPEAAPPAIFPWERQENRPKPTRKFADDQRPEPPKPKEKPKPKGLQMPPAILVGDDIFTPFSPQANAWDENPSIERYVRAVFESQNPHRARHVPTASQEILSPTGGTTRRESLILTDFPSADDRPSLPVTPAPIRRPTFWGEERDEAGELPAAEGVPDQAEWVCPQCGFSSDAPVAFLRARSASAASAAQAVVEEHLVSPTTAPVLPLGEESGVSVAAAQPAARLPSLPPQPQPLPPPASARNAWDDIPLPPHLRPRPKTRHSSSDFSFSSASTAVGPSMSATAGPEDMPKPVPSPIAELRAADEVEEKGGKDEEAVLVESTTDAAEYPLSATPAYISGDVTPRAPSSPPAKETLPPPSWLTGPIR